MRDDAPGSGPPLDPREGEPERLDEADWPARDPSAAGRRSEQQRLGDHVLQLTSDGVVVADALGRIREYAGGAERILGWRRDEVLGKSLAADFRLDFPDGNREQILRELASGETVRARAAVQRKDGSWADLNVSAVPLRDDGGAVTGWLAVARDVGPLLMAKRKLRTSRDRLASLARDQDVLLETASVGLCKLIDRRLVWVNRRVEEIVGCAREQMVGRTTRMLHAEGASYERIGREAYPVLAAGRTYETELPFVRPDGRRIVVRCWGRATDPSNLGAGTIWAVEDVTAQREAARRLASSEERFRLLVENAAEVIVLHDLEGRFLHVNRQACESLGYTREELLRMRVTDVEQDVDLATARSQWERVRPGEPVTFLGRHRRKDGTVFPVEIRFVCVDVAGDRLYIGMSRDVTERQRAEDRLRYEASLLEKVADPVVSTDEALRIRSWNRAAEATYGFTESEALGRQVDELLRTEYVSPSREEAARQLFQRGAGRAEVVHRDERGARVHVEANVVALVDASGAVGGTLGILRDVTASKRAEEARRQAERALRESEARLRASEERLRLALQAAKAGTWDWDFATNANTWSDGIWQLYGLEPGSCVPSHEAWLATVHPDDLERVEAHVREALRARSEVTVEYRVRERGGATRWLMARGQAVLDARGGVSGYRGIAVDVTRERENEVALRVSQRALRLLVATNEAILRARNEGELFGEVCRAAVEQGGFRKVWAGLAERGTKSIRIVACYGGESFGEHARVTWADEPNGRGPTGQAMRSARVVVVHDVATDPCFAPWREPALRSGCASYAVLPLVHGDERLGVIGAYSSERDAFDAGAIELLQRLADDLTFGLVALRTRTEAERAAAEVDTACRVVGLSIARLDLRTGLVRLDAPSRELRGLPRGGPDVEHVPLEQAASRLHPDDRSLLDANLARFRNARPEDEPTTRLHAYRYLLDDGSTRWVERAEKVVFDGAGEPEMLLTASLDVTDRVRERDQLRALTSRLQAVREEEKLRIARDLHDDLGQMLTALQLELRGAERRAEELGGGQAGPILDCLVAASELAEGTVAAVQRLSHHLRPEALERVGLLAALRQELRSFEHRAGVVVEAALDAEVPSGEVATALFRIAQEALTNVARHAAAKRVEVRLAAVGRLLMLEVADDGRGIPPGKGAKPRLGLLGMHERARALGGQVVVWSREGGGTMVFAEIPLAAERDE